MKTLRIFSMAALVLVMAACTSSDIEIPQQDGKMHFTAKIAAPNSGSATKTVYTVDGSTINVAWKAKEDGGYEGDKIALIHNGVKDIATVTAVDESGNATIEATISGTPQDGDDVVLVYPAASVDATGSGTDFEPKAEYLALGFNQDGTLDYIQNNLDGRQGSGQLSVSGGTASLKGSVKMNSQIAIWKLNLQDNAATPNALSAAALTITVGEIPVAAATASSATSEYYLCLVPATLSSGDLTISATVDSDTYSYCKEGGVSLVAGKYYQSTVKMPIYNATKNIAEGPVTVPAGEHWLVVGNGSNTITIGDGAKVTLQNVNISAGDVNAISCLGDANIILKGTNNVANASLDYATIKGPANALEKTLTISGEGKLIAKANGNGSNIVQGAIIGSDMNGTCGNIVITGGTVEASASAKDVYGAAIGAGRGQGGGNTSQCGDITISGGTVNAIGGDGAGIGSGTSFKFTGSGQIIGDSHCGIITIKGGAVVTAQAGRGAAIGSGYANSSPNSSGCGNIVITGGTITAETTNSDTAGAAIGAGAGNKASDIKISGGNVTATGKKYAAGIGAGSGTSVSGSVCGNISINGGTIVAKGGSYGAGIGTGYSGTNGKYSTCGKIEITSGVNKVTASNGYTGGLAKSIGRGYANNSRASCGEVWIGGTKTGEISDNPYTYPPQP